MAKILIAEDDVHVMRLTSMWLAKNGHEVVEARNGNEAMEIVREGGVECVVSDVNMPQCDGITFVTWLRTEAKLDIPVIMLSARCDQAPLGKQLAEHNVTIHPKPFSPSRLSAEIEEKLAAATRS